MSIIIISSNSYSGGEEVAEQVADRLGYRCIAGEIVSEVSREFNNPETKLSKVKGDAPSYSLTFTDSGKKYVACLRAALLKEFRHDNMVYHGLGGLSGAQDLNHILKIRLFADTGDRVKNAMKRNNVSQAEALQILKADDEQRRRWDQRLYGMDMTDSVLYDLLIHTGKFTVDDAAGLICQVAGMDRFRTIDESRKAVENMALAAEVKATLFEIGADAKVCASDGLVCVGAKLPSLPWEAKGWLVGEMKKLVQSVPGVKMVDLQPHHLVGKQHYFFIGPDHPAWECC